MLNTSNILPALLENSSDAQLNLFDVTFILNNASDEELGLQNSLTVRTNVFNSPSFQNNTVQVPYMNTTLSVVSPGTSIPRTLNIQTRLDDGYRVVSFLRGRVLANEDANWDYDENKKFDLIVYAYNAPGPITETNISRSYSNYIDEYGPVTRVAFNRNTSTNLYLQPVYQWVFRDCYLTNIPSLSYNYQGSAQGVFPLTIVFNRYEEGKYSEGSTTTLNAAEE